MLGTVLAFKFQQNLAKFFAKFRRCHTCGDILWYLHQGHIREDMPRCFRWQAIWRKIFLLLVKALTEACVLRE